MSNMPSSCAPHGFLILLMIIGYQVLCSSGQDSSTCPEDTFMDSSNQCVRCPPNLTSGSDRVNCTIVLCSPGYRYDITSGSPQCSVCPVGWYKERTANSECIQCDGIYTTASEGSTRKTDCTVVACLAGYYRVKDGGCEPCPLGSYQIKREQTSCDVCEAGLTTMIIAASSIQACILLCQEGEYYHILSSRCRPCAVGTYKDATGNFEACTTCPAGNITLSFGATRVAQCDVRDCLAGYSRLSESSECQKCRKNTYQPSDYQTECFSCGNGRITMREGSTRQADCIVDCPAGQQYDYSPSIKACQPCEQAFYRNKSETDLCVRCKDNKWTNQDGSTSESDCLPVPAGQIPKLRLRITVVMELRLTLPNCGLNEARYTNIIGNTVTSAFMTLSQRLSGLCTMPDCNNVAVEDIVCLSESRRQRAQDELATIELQAKNITDTLIDIETGYEYPTITKLNDELSILENYRPDPIYNIVPTSGYVTKTLPVCKDGQILNKETFKCVDCAVGQYHHRAADVCVSCPLHSFQDQTAQMSCKPCQDHFYTVSTGTVYEGGCDAFCAINRTYCLNGGSCVMEFGIAPRCDCTGRYDGERCATTREQGSERDVIIGGVVGALVLVSVIVIIVVAYRVRRRKRKALNKKLKEKHNSNKRESNESRLKNRRQRGSSGISNSDSYVNAVYHNSGYSPRKSDGLTEPYAPRDPLHDRGYVTAARHQDSQREFRHDSHRWRQTKD